VFLKKEKTHMAKISAAVNNLLKGKTVTRKAWKAGTVLKMDSGNIIRIRPNGTEATARLPSDDLLADDYTVVN